MARNSRIRITNNDKALYAKLVKNTKAKISRTKKKYGIDLTNEIELPPLESFQTRKEFNEWKRKQESFTNRANQNYQFVKNKYGIVASKAKINEIEKNTKEAQRIVDEQREEIEDKPFISGGKQYGTVGQRMQILSPSQVTGISRPSDFNFDDVRSYARLRTLDEGMAEKATPDYYDRRMSKMHQNFIEIVEKSFNSDWLSDKLVERLKKIPPDDFFELYLTFNEISFEYFDSEGEDVTATEAMLNKIHSYLDRYERGDVNLDLKGF